VLVPGEVSFYTTGTFRIIGPPSSRKGVLHWTHSSQPSELFFSQWEWNLLGFVNSGNRWDKIRQHKKTAESLEWWRHYPWYKCTICRDYTVFKRIVSRDFVVCFLVSFDRSEVPTHTVGSFALKILFLCRIFKFLLLGLVSLLCE
jgi:hypothetical protein